MPQLTQANRDEATRRYAAGESAVSLAVEYGISRQGLVRAIRRAGIDVRAGGKLLPSQREECVRRYESGEPAASLAEEYGISAASVFSLLSHRGSAVRSPMKRYKLNGNYFASIDSEEKAYWLGFLMADGCVMEIASGQKIISLGLSIKDRTHLDLFRSHIGSTHPLEHRVSGYGTDTVRLKFSSAARIIASGKWSRHAAAGQPGG